MDYSSSPQPAYGAAYPPFYGNGQAPVQAQLHQARAAAAAVNSSAPFPQALYSPAHPQQPPFGPPPQQQHLPHQQPQQSPRSVPPPGSQAPPMNTQPGATPVKPDPSNASAPVKQVSQSPASPGLQARTQDRATTLLEINSILIKEVCQLQSQGKAGQVGVGPDGKQDAEKPMQSKDYVDYMRRLQSNLAYLAQNAEKQHKPNTPLQPGPAIMSAPSSPPELIRLYQRLAELFPGWKGQATPAKPGQGPGGGQGHQRMGSTLSQSGGGGGLGQNWGQGAMHSMQQVQAKTEPPQ